MTEVRSRRQREWNDDCMPHGMAERLYSSVVTGRHRLRCCAGAGAPRNREVAMNGLTVEQVEQFHTEGYLLVEDLFDPDQDIAPILNEYAGVLDTLANDLY